jgi:hypothetical protein|tara:strand:- start:17902 stop:18165 length:264 start_codon:yes stop_codon:yes gene_type:complete
VKFYYILFILIGFSSYVTGKDRQVTSISDTKKLQQNSPKISNSTNDSLNSTINQSALKMPNKNIDTKKFNPSEEISEDLAIPFPVDI